MSCWSVKLSAVILERGPQVGLLTFNEEVPMSINLQPSVLDNIEIASPCSASWDDMKGNFQVRDCSQCKLSVYNLSAMSRKEAEALIYEREGRLCVRLYRRADGTVISDNCPVALRKIRDSFRNVARLAAGALSFLLTISIVRAGNESTAAGNSCQPADVQAGAKPKGGGHRMGRYVPVKGYKPIRQTTNGTQPRPFMGDITTQPKQPEPVRLMQGEPTPQVAPTSSGSPTWAQGNITKIPVSNSHATTDGSPPKQLMGKIKAEPQ